MQKILGAVVVLMLVAAGCEPSEQPVTQNTPPPAGQQGTNASASAEVKATANPDDFSDYLLQTSAEEQAAAEADDSDLAGNDSAELDSYMEVTNEVQF